MDREEGFYLIECDPAPVIALWEQGVWWLPGKEQETADAVVLSERIYPTNYMKEANDVNWIAILAATRTDDPDFIIKALQDQGYAIVPVEPTPEMVQAGGNAILNTDDETYAGEAASAYRAMISTTKNNPI